MSSNRRGQPSHPSRTSSNRPLYAIDFTAVACGKRIANTKRRVRWRFGFANPDAIAAGETGTACRGEEHDVTLVWSITSGKRLILADGQEVHYSNSRSAVLDFSWTMRGNHVLKVVAHATAPMSAEPGFRQYDFFVDGRSFFSFPKVYRLGLTGSKTMSPTGSSRMAESSGRRKTQGGSGGNIAALEAPHNPDEEEAYLREAIKASLETEAKRKEDDGKGSSAPKISAEATDLLIDFMGDFDAGNAAPAPAGNELVAAPAQMNQWAMAPPPAPAPAENGWALPPSQPAAAMPPPPQQHQSYDAPSSNPFAPPPTPQQLQPQGPVGNFMASPPPPQPAAGDPFAAPSFAQPPAAAPAPFSPQPPAAPVASPFSPQPPAPTPGTPAAPSASATSNGSGNVVLSMNSLTNDGLLGNGSAPPAGSTTLADKALQNLMGSIDSFGITGSAAKPPAANPFDSGSNLMGNATLGEIKAKTSTGSEKKPVMNTPPGAMVVASGQQGNWGGYGQGGGMQQQQPPQYTMAGGYPQQQQMGYGQPQMGGMQQQPMQQPMQQPPMQGYGQPSMYGQQPPQQGGWGGPSY